jgi:hypothetical protein
MIIYYNLWGRNIIKKLIIVGILLMAIGFSFITSINALFLVKENYIYENHEVEEFNEYEKVVVSMAPLLFSEIEILNGTRSEIREIERILNSVILQFMTKYLEINVSDLEIKISYEKNIPLILSRRYSYLTGVSEDENITVYDEKHSVHIKGLDGQVLYTRGFHLIFPARYFMLIGTYEEIVFEVF